MPGSMETVDESATGMPGGQLTTSGAQPNQLTTTSRGCKAVWVGVPLAESGGVNTGNIYIGDTSNQYIPLKPTDYQGMTIEIDDPSKIFVKAASVGDKVNYHIFL